MLKSSAMLDGFFQQIEITYYIWIIFPPNINIVVNYREEKRTHLLDIMTGANREAIMNGGNVHLFVGVRVQYNSLIYTNCTLFLLV
jgi:hypothetical protein